MRFHVGKGARTKPGRQVLLYSLAPQHCFHFQPLLLGQGALRLAGEPPSRPACGFTGGDKSILTYGNVSHIVARMKTTLEIDEKRLRSVMALTGLKTRRAAVDYSLAEVERQARVSKVMERAWSPERLKDVLAPRYDVVALRERERPGRT